MKIAIAEHLGWALLLLGAGCATTGSNDHAAHAKPATSPSERYLAQGDEFARAGDLIRAEQYFALALRAGYPEQAVLPRLLHVCLAGSRLRAALSYAESHLLRHPDAWVLRSLVASLEAALGQPELARRELRRVLADRPEEAEANYMLAVLERDVFAGDDSASQAFAAYLRARPHGDHQAEARSWLREHPLPAEAVAVAPGTPPTLLQPTAALVEAAP